MKNLKKFSDIFRDNLGDLDTRKPNGKVGKEVLDKLSKTIALESIDDQKSLAEDLASFMMACESAKEDLERLRGISYSIALKHEDVIGIEVNTNNFSTHVGKKNYDVALENIKGFLLIGVSVAIAAGIGYLIFKLLTAKKEKPNKGKEVVAVAKDINRAVELFASVDLSILPKDVQDKYFEKAFNESHVEIQRIASRDQFIKRGYELEVANQLSISQATVLDDFVLNAKNGSWVVECHNRVAPSVLENLEFFVETVESLDNVSDDVLAEKLTILMGRVDAARDTRHQDYHQCAKASGYEGSTPLFEDWAEWLRMGSMTDLTPQMNAVVEGVSVPSQSEYASFGKIKDKMGKLGERFQKAANHLEELFDSDGLSELIDKLKFDLEELELMRNMVGVETQAIADSFKIKAEAAKVYSKRVFAVLEELIDEDMKKDIKAQIKKAVTTLPKRVMVTEGLETDEFEDPSQMMAVEGLSTGATVGLAIVGIGVLAGAIFVVARMMRKNGSGTDKKCNAIDDKIEKINHKYRSAEQRKHEKDRISDYITKNGINFNVATSMILRNGREDWRPLPSDVGRSLKEEINAINVSLGLTLKTAREFANSGFTDVKGLLNSYHLDRLSVGNGWSELNLLAEALGDTPESKEISRLASSLPGSANDKMDTEEILGIQEKLQEVVDKFIVRVSEDYPNPGKVEIGNLDIVLDDIRKSNMLIRANSKSFAEKIGPDILDIEERFSKVSEEYKLARQSSPEFRAITDHAKAIIDLKGYALRAYMRIVNLYQDAASRALSILDSAGKDVATESITGDGIDLVEKEVTQYLEQPEYQQAGYRFDPRDGYDGANLMAMESWSMGAKVALGIGAAVTVLGIGALIASAIVKRNATIDERHSSKQNIEAIKNNLVKLDENVMRILHKIVGLRRAFGSSGMQSQYPQVQQQLDDIYNEVKQIQDRKVERDGQIIDQVQYLLDEIGDQSTIQLQRLLAIATNVPNRSYFELVGNQTWIGSVGAFYDNVVAKAIGDLDTGRDPEAILEDVEKWWETLEGRKAKQELKDALEDADALRSKIDRHWGTDLEGAPIAHRSNILNILGYAADAQEDLVKVHKRVTERFTRYQLNEKTINRFKEMSEKVRGNRDAAASLLRRIDEFRPFFALYTRMVRHETEYLEGIMSFIDRIVKVFTRMARNDIDRIKQLSADITKMESEPWASNK